MNCAQAHHDLPLLLYGDLDTRQAEALREHLATCPACAKAWADLERVRDALDTLPAPVVRVDTVRILEEAARAAQRRVKRWRRMGIAAAIAAALLLAAFLSPLRLRVDEGQVVLRWVDTPPPGPKVIEAPALAAAWEADVADLRSEVQTLRRLVHLLAGAQQAGAQDRLNYLAELRKNTEAWQAGVDRRLDILDRDLGALYSAQFGPFAKGE